MQYTFLKQDNHKGLSLFFSSILYLVISIGAIFSYPVSSLNALEDPVVQVAPLDPWFESSPSLFLEPIQAVDNQGDRYFRGVVELPLARGWHTYWKNPGLEGGFSPNFEWNLPAGIDVQHVEWPMPYELRQLSSQEPISAFVYSGLIQWIVTFKVSASYEITSGTDIGMKLTWIACGDDSALCIPEETRFQAPLVLNTSPDAQQLKERFDGVIRQAFLNVASDQKGVRLKLDREQSSLILFLPIQREDIHTSQVNQGRVDSARLFFENIGIQTTAESKLLLKANGEPYALRLTIPQESVQKLAHAVQERDLSLARLSGVYSYILYNKQLQTAERLMTGRFTDIPLSVLSMLPSSKSVQYSEPSTPLVDQRLTSGEIVKELEGEEKIELSPYEQIISQLNHDGDLSVQEKLSSLFIYIGLAFLGGIILNIMPCVLPVVGLKVLHLLSYRTVHEKGSGSLAEAGEREEKKQSVFKYGLSFTAGVISAFWILACIVYLLQYLGRSVGWGFQLQEPWFVLLLIALLFAMSLNMFGLFEIGMGLSSTAAAMESGASSSPHRSNEVLYDSKDPARDAQKIYADKVNKKRHLNSFMSGFLVTAIATPCTGPLLGSVIGFLATLHPLQGILIFTALGAGVSFPYLMCTLFPSLLKLLPKPGAWMVTLKQFLGFLLLMTVAWLIWVLDAQISPLSPSLLFSLFLSIGLSAWIYGRWATPLNGTIARYMATTLSLSLLALSLVLGYSIISQKDEIYTAPFVSEEAANQLEWQPFSLDALNQALEDGKPVFVEVTAKWCLTCQLNKTIFISSKVIDSLRARDAVLLRADWTKKDESITQFLRSFGRNGVPTYIYFPKDLQKRKDRESPRVLPELLTVDSLLQGIDEKVDG